MMMMWIWIWICCCARVDACTPAPVRLLTAPLSKSVQDSVMTIMLVSSPRNVLVWNWSFTVSTACCNPETWYEVFFGGRGGYMKMIMKQQPGRCSSMQKVFYIQSFFSSNPTFGTERSQDIPARPRTSNHRGTSFCVDLFHFLPVWTTYFCAIRVLKLVVQCQAQALPQLLFVDFGYFGCFSNGGTPQKQQKNSLVGENKKKWFHVLSILAHFGPFQVPLIPQIGRRVKNQSKGRDNIFKDDADAIEIPEKMLTSLKRWPLWRVFPLPSSELHPRVQVQELVVPERGGCLWVGQMKTLRKRWATGEYNICTNSPPEIWLES